MYTPHTPRDIAQMLDAIGVASLDELLAVPEALALKGSLDVVPALPEYLIGRRFERIARKNAGAHYRSFLGAGAYRHYVPPAIARIAMRGEFLTAYTPYQAEVSQGYLQAIYEWQTYICSAHRHGHRQRLGVRRRDRAGRRRDHGAQRDRAAEAAWSRARSIPTIGPCCSTYCDGLDVAIDEVPYTRRRRHRLQPRSKPR